VDIENGFDMVIDGEIDLISARCGVAEDASFLFENF